MSEFAVLILSCDKYADLWKPFLEQFRKYLSVEGTRMYLGSNLVACDENGVVPLLSGHDTDWSSSFRRILEQVPERKLFVILEDLFLKAAVDPQRFAATRDFLLAEDAMHIKYWATVPVDAPTRVPGIGIHARGAPYRATVCGFWDRDFLRKLLLDGEDPWNFEVLGSYRTSYSDGVYGLTEPLCLVTNMVEKGRWIPESVDWARREGVAIQIDRRPMLVGSSQAISRLKMFYFRMMMRVPWRWRLKIMNKLRLALITY